MLESPEAARPHFEAALSSWDSAERAKVQSEFGLLGNKALALLCLGETDEATETLKRAITRRLPGDTVDLTGLYLLRKAAQPVAGLETAIALLEAAGK